MRFQWENCSKRSKKRRVLQAFKFYVRSSEKIEEANFSRKEKIVKDVILFSADTHLTVRSDDEIYEQIW